MIDVQYTIYLVINLITPLFYFSFFLTIFLIYLLFPNFLQWSILIINKNVKILLLDLNRLARLHVAYTTL